MKLKQKKHQQIPGIIQEKVATPETPQIDEKIKTKTEEPAQTDRADQIPETDQDQETILIKRQKQLQIAQRQKFEKQKP